MGPYDYTLQGPQQGFMQGLQIGQVMLARRAEAEKRRKAEEALEARRQVYSSLGPNATADDYFKAAQALPDEREAILKEMQTMGEARRGMMFDAGAGAFALLRDENGRMDPEPAAKKLEESAAALESGGDKQTAQQLRDSASALRLDPIGGKRILGVLLASANPEKFKAISMVNEGPDLTSFQKDLIAAGIDPNSPEGRQQANDYLAARTAVEVNIPGKGVFKGPLSEYQKLYGGVSEAPNVPAVGSVRGGYRFRGGNPSLESNWEPVKGGVSFQGIEGERVTSTRRSPARNAAVGGAPNSYHLSGQARDSVPPRGMSMAEYAAKLRRLNPGMKVINEGDHVHMEPM